MMRKLIFIFLIFHVHIFHCTKIPKQLRCVDELCDEKISMGRIVKPFQPLYGNLGNLKISSKVIIKGKNVNAQNTLWLIEQEGFHGFVDFSFIKENRNDVVEDLAVVKNPFDKVVDETEDIDDSTDEIGLFSKEKSKENDETENFSEISSDVNVDKEKSKNVEISNDNPNKNQTNSNSLENVKVDNTPNLNNVQDDKESPKLKVNSESVQEDTLNKKTTTNDIKIKLKETKIPKVNEDADVGQNLNKNIVSKEKKETPKQVEEIKVNDANGHVQKDSMNKHDGKVNLNNNSQEKLDKDLKLQKPSSSSRNSEKDSKIKTNDKLSQNLVGDNEIYKESLENFHKPLEQIIETPKTDKENLKKHDKITDSLSINTEIKLTNDSKPLENFNKKPENNESDSQLNILKTRESSNKLTSEKQTESPPKVLANENSDEKISQKEIEKQKINSSVEEQKLTIQSISHENNDINNRLEISDDSRSISNKIQTESNKSLNTVKEESIEKQETKDIPKEPIKYLENDSEVHSKSDEKLPFQTSDRENISIKNQEKLSDIHKSQSKSIEENKSQQSIQKSIEINNQIQLVENSTSNEKFDNLKIIDPEKTNSKSEIHNNSEIDKFQSSKMKKEIKKRNIGIEGSRDMKISNDESKESINNDPWLDNSGKPVQEIDNQINQIKSPIIKLIMKIDILSQFVIKSFVLKLGFDSSSKLSQFTNYWFQMSLENFVSIFLFFSILFLIVYTPKLLKFNRDWKTEFIRQTQLLKELELKLQNTEEVRHKLTVQNHNFEKVIDEYKQQINEIQEDAAKNKKTVILEIEKIKKSNESNVKNLTNELTNKIQQCNLLEKDLFMKMELIDNLEEEKRQMEIKFDDDKSQLEIALAENKRELIKMSNLNDHLNHSFQQASSENDQLKIRIQDLNQDLNHRTECYTQLEKSFEHLKIFEGLDFEEYNQQKSIYLDLTKTKQKLEVSEQNIEQLNNELQIKSEVIVELTKEKVEMEKNFNQYRTEKSEAIALKEAAEMKLNVLSEYFKSKEVEMAKTLGHQVIESTQSMDQVDFLKHRIQNLEIENGEMSKTIQRLKLEIKEVQTFATKCKTDANEEVNKLFLKNINLERSLQTEKDENKKLRAKLSHYCGPTPPRNQTSNYNHNKTDRPPSRQSGISDSVAAFQPFSLIPFPSPQSPIPNNNQFSGRNSVNSKKSNNT